MAGTAQFSPRLLLVASAGILTVLHKYAAAWTGDHSTADSHKIAGENHKRPATRQAIILSLWRDRQSEIWRGRADRDPEPV